MSWLHGSKWQLLLNNKGDKPKKRNTMASMGEITRSRLTLRVSKKGSLRRVGAMAHHRLDVEEPEGTVSIPVLSHCEGCKEDRPEVFCEECNSHLCARCKMAHQNLYVGGDHNLIGLHDNELTTPFRDIELSGGMASELSPQCTKHPKYQCNIFCKDCLLVICKKCKDHWHKRHNVEKCANSVGNMQATTLSHMQKALQFIESLEVLKTEARKKSGLTKIDEISEEIERRRAMIMTAVNEHSSTLLDHLQHKRERITQNLERHLDFIDSAVQETEKLENDLKFARKIEDPDTISAALHGFSEKFPHLQSDKVKYSLKAPAEDEANLIDGEKMISEILCAVKSLFTIQCNTEIPGLQKLVKMTTLDGCWRSSSSVKNKGFLVFNNTCPTSIFLLDSATLEIQQQAVFQDFVMDATDLSDDISVVLTGKKLTILDKNLSTLKSFNAEDNNYVTRGICYVSKNVFARLDVSHSSSRVCFVSVNPSKGKIHVDDTINITRSLNPTISYSMCCTENKEILIMNNKLKAIHVVKKDVMEKVIKPLKEDGTLAITDNINCIHGDSVDKIFIGSNVGDLLAIMPNKNCIVKKFDEQIRGIPIHNNKLHIFLYNGSSLTTVCVFATDF